jgi:hypothetical protein
MLANTQNYQTRKLPKSQKLQSYKLQVHFCIFTSLHMLNFHIFILACITKFQIKNQKLQPTNNIVSKFTSNKSHVGITQNTNYKLQNCKFTSLQVTN